MQTLDTIESNTGDIDALELDDVLAEDAQRVAHDRAEWSR